MLGEFEACGPGPREDAGLGQEPMSAFPSTGLGHSLAIVSKVLYCMDIFPFNS